MTRDAQAATAWVKAVALLTVMLIIAMMAQ
jgi:hypothetical protein